MVEDAIVVIPVEIEAVLKVAGAHLWCLLPPTISRRPGDPSSTAVLETAVFRALGVN